MLQEVRRPLLDEAQRSPNLLADLAGLEEYIAESYDARSFVELLQNADDVGAERFAIAVRGKLLYVANDGRPFSQSDFESLCRSAASNKHRGPSIGYRGIGFKSVVTFSENVYLFSDTLSATFSRARTMQAVPGAKRVPLVRIPHSVEREESQICEEGVRALFKQGFKTVFVFSGLKMQAIETEFAAFDCTSLLFLRSVNQLSLRGPIETVASLTRRKLTNGDVEVILSTGNDKRGWIIKDRDGLSLAFATDSKGIVPLEDDRAVVHAFLPTNEKTGIGAKVNGDVSTDPSRTRIVLDERTKGFVNRLSSEILDLLLSSLDAQESESAHQLIRALSPRTDPRLASFQRPSFERELLASLLEHGKERLSKWRFRPKWFQHGADFESVARASAIPFLSCELETILGLLELMKGLGAAEASLSELSRGLNDKGVSVIGAADILQHLVDMNATGRIGHSEVNSSWKVWPVNGKTISLKRLLESPASLDSRCLDILRERLGTLSNLQRLIEFLSNATTAKLIVPDEQSSSGEQHRASIDNSRVMPGKGHSVPSGVKRLKLQKWRSAEQQVLELLQQKGWKVRDVSRQNLGFDIEAHSPDGEVMFIEVKSINRIGETFTLTSNEEVVARDKSKSYVIALVLDNGNYLEVAMIRDPVNCLDLVRQCRQWVWICDEYPFDAEQIELM